MQEVLKSLFLTLAGVVILPWSAQAATPTRGANCAHIQLAIPSGVDVPAILFDEDCSTAFVPPPTQGVRSIQLASNGSTDLYQCDGLTYLNQTITSLFKTRYDYSLAISANQQRFTEVSQRLLGFEKEVTRISHLQIQALDDIEVQRATVYSHNRSVDGLRRQYRQCRGRSCSDLRQQLNQAKALRDQAQSQLGLLENRYDRRRRRISDLKAQIIKTEQERQGLVQGVPPLPQNLNTLEEITSRQIAKYAGIEGVQLSVDLDLQWDLAVQKISDHNQGNGLVFLKLPLYRTQVFMDDFDPAEQIRRGSSVIGRSVASEAFQPIVSGPHQQDVFGQELPSYGPSSVVLTLNLKGTCPFYDRTSGQFYSDRYQRFKSSFVATVRYSYLVKEAAGYSISFNQHKAIDRIAEHFLQNPVLDLALVTDGADRFVPDFVLESDEISSTAAHYALAKEKKLFYFSKLVRSFAEQQALGVDSGGTYLSGGAMQNYRYRTGLSSAEIEQTRHRLKSKVDVIYSELSRGGLFTEATGQYSFN